MHAFLHVVPNFHSSARCSFSVLQERLANLEACATEDETGGGDSEPSGTLGTQRPPRAAGITLKGDVETFAWILHYIEAPLRPPTLNAALVVNVLVAADALAMDHLVHHSLRYMCAHLRDVLRTSLDLTCIHDKLAVSLADLVHPAAAKLAGLKDRRDMLLPRIYKPASSWTSGLRRKATGCRAASGAANCFTPAPSPCSNAASRPPQQQQQQH